MTPPHPFDNAIHLDTSDGNVRRGRTHPEWANQVGPFGGITAAVMLRAIETQPDRIGEPLALTVNFTAPIADGDFDISLRAAHQPHQSTLDRRTQSGRRGHNHRDRGVRRPPRYLG